MTQEDFVNMMRGLDFTLSKFNNTLSQQGISAVVGSFSGESDRCRDWLSSLEKFAEVHEFDDARKINAALLTAKSSVEDFIRRWKVARGAEAQTWY